jgi:hypothetical protein
MSALASSMRVEDAVLISHELVATQSITRAPSVV